MKILFQTIMVFLVLLPLVQAHAGRRACKFAIENNTNYPMKYELKWEGNDFIHEHANLEGKVMQPQEYDSDIIIDKNKDLGGWDTAKLIIDCYILKDHTWQGIQVITIHVGANFDVSKTYSVKSIAQSSVPAIFTDWDTKNNSNPLIYDGGNQDAQFAIGIGGPYNRDHIG